MTFQNRRALRFTLAFVASLALFAGGCAAPKPTAQTAKTPIATTQSAPLQTLQVEIKKLAERRVFAGVVGALQFSPDGVTLASAGGTTHDKLLPDWLAGRLKVVFLDSRTLRTTKTLPLLPEADFVVFAPNLKRIVTNPSVYQGLQLFDATNGKSLWREFTDKPAYPPLPNGSDGMFSITELEFSRHGDKVLINVRGQSGDHGGVYWCPIEDKTLGDAPAIPELDLAPEVYEKTYWGGESNCAAFSPDGETIVAGSRDNWLALYNAKTKRMIWQQDRYMSHDTLPQTKTSYLDFRLLQVLAFSPNGQTIASGYSDNTVSLWNAQNGPLLRTIKAHSKAVRNVVFSPDSSVFASGADDGTVVLSSTRSGEILRVLDSKNGAVTALTFAPDGNCLAAGYADGTVSLWRVR